jgi:lipid-A-disaccharide synthase-like uncharacterized protein
VTVAEVAIKAIGWIGQACFFSRFLIQWLASERVKRSMVPSVFWRLSLVGSMFGGLYAWLGPPHDVVFGASYAFNMVVYARNLVLERRPESRLKPLTLSIVAVVVAVGVGLALTRDPKVMAVLAQESHAWLTIGIIGQVIFGSRFLLQWVLAERRGRAELPPSFFMISFVGSLLLLAYAIHKRDDVLIAGMVLVPIISARNLVLQRRAAVSGRPPTSAGPTLR